MISSNNGDNIANEILYQMYLSLDKRSRTKMGEFLSQVPFSLTISLLKEIEVDTSTNRIQQFLKNLSITKFESQPKIVNLINNISQNLNEYEKKEMALNDVIKLEEEYLKKKVKTNSIRNEKKFEYSIVHIKKLQNFLQNFLEQQLEKYKSLFVEYFNRNPKSKGLLGYDLESYHYKPLFGIGVYINPKLKIQVSLWVRKHINSKKFCGKVGFEKWLKFRPPKSLIMHGSNKHEKITSKIACKEEINTEILLENFRKNYPNLKRSIASLSLHSFEIHYGISRRHCLFFKHELSRNSYFRMMYLSFRNFTRDIPFKQCQICKNPQNIFGYCAEDVLSTIILYVVIQNRKFHPV